MSARKLSRVAGMVFVLVAAVGGLVAASSAVGHVTGGVAASSVLYLETTWE